MKFVKIAQSELESIRELYESVMSYACHGLFYREGLHLGAEMGEMASKGEEDFFETCRKILIGRGWVDDIKFEKDRALANGSIEVSKGSQMETCHRLRGIVCKLYEIKLKKKVKFSEPRCESTGATECLFQMEA